MQQEQTKSEKANKLHAYRAQLTREYWRIVRACAMDVGIEEASAYWGIPVGVIAELYRTLPTNLEAFSLARPINLAPTTEDSTSHLMVRRLLASMADPTSPELYTVSKVSR